MRTPFSSSSFLLFYIIVSMILCTVMGADVQLGSILSASDQNSKWTSPDNVFSLSFVKDPSGVTSDYFAAILYDDNPNILIWVAGAGNSSYGGATDSTATLRLVSNGNLELRNGSSNALVWESSTANQGVSVAALDESGNFILKNGSGSTIWSTFDNPTDTIVPKQNFTLNQVLRNGVYSFSLLSNGNLSLYWNGSESIQYYNSGLNSSASVNVTSPTIYISLVGIIRLSDPNLQIPLDLAYSSDFSEEGTIFRFLKLDVDGNLRIYSSPRENGIKSVRWSALSNQCLVFGYCGNYGICSYNETGPICLCPSQNFELLDPTDSRKGCKRKVDLQSCIQNQTTLQLDHTVLLTYPSQYTTELFSTGFQPCRSNCLVNDPCVGSTSLADGTGFCYQKVSTFISGYQSPAIPSTSFFKICGQPMPNPPAGSVDVTRDSGGKLKPWIVVVVVLVTLFCLIVAEAALWWWCFKNSQKFGSLSAHYALLEYASGAPVQFSYKELQRATKGFKEKLGAGGFGAVYKGVLANRTVAAVKQLEGIEQGEKQFRMEVATISSTHHLNLVRLIGFCSEGRHRLLVYEFMKNSSLDNFLFSSDDDRSGKLLNWETRFNIALGTARGITYLHEECRDCIVHCDIKPENILLDENYNAKVSDFGLAKLINSKDHRYRTLTSVRGTRGYLAPEWLANLPITLKSDVYSYGMVLLEILSGKRNFEVSEQTNRKKFSLWAYEEFDRGNIESIVDKRLSSNETLDMEQMTRAIQVSFWCIQEQPSQRPMMGKVVQMLEGITDIGKPPAPKTIVTEGSVTGSSTSAFSAIVAPSAPALSSSSSSLKTPAGISSASTMNVEKPSSSLLASG